jgi:hypothetical protein
VSWLGLDGAPGIAGADDDANGLVDDPAEIGLGDDIGMMGPDRRPGQAGADDDGDGIVDNVSELFWSPSDDVRPAGRGFAEPFGYNLGPGVPSYALYGLGLDTTPGRAGVDDDANGTVDDAFDIGWPDSDDPTPMLRAPFALARTYDTWCTAYTRPRQLPQDFNGNGRFDTNEWVRPVAPPYIVPLRGIQIKIRYADPESRLTREITIIQELQP